jgi:hypothetical protein
MPCEHVAKCDWCGKIVCNECLNMCDVCKRRPQICDDCWPDHKNANAGSHIPEVKDES